MTGQRYLREASAEPDLLPVLTGLARSGRMPSDLRRCARCPEHLLAVICGHKFALGDKARGSGPAHGNPPTAGGAVMTCPGPRLRRGYGDHRGSLLHVSSLSSGLFCLAGRKGLISSDSSLVSYPRAASNSSGRSRPAGASQISEESGMTSSRKPRRTVSPRRPSTGNPRSSLLTLCGRAGITLGCLHERPGSCPWRISQYVRRRSRPRCPGLRRGW